jgi:hypothetical protein
MRVRQTKKGQKGIYYVASLLFLMLSLAICSSFSYAQNNSHRKKTFTLHNQKTNWGREFSLKKRSIVSNILNTAEQTTTATRSSAEYVKNGFSHSSRLIEENPKKGQEIFLAKPPLNHGKIVGEFMTGTMLGIGMGIGAAYIGASISYNGDWFSEWPGAFIGFTLAYPLGCALGVYAVGNLGSDTGSFSSALGAAYGGILLGAAGAWALSKVSHTAAGLAFLTAPPLLATIVFNKTRRYKYAPTANVSLLNFRDGKMNLALPAFFVLPSAPGSSKLDWFVNLASVEL